MDRLREWLVEEQPKHLPKGPLGSAISYALNQWDRPLCFVDNVNVPVDNNASESALRIVALNRKIGSSSVTPGPATITPPSPRW